MVVTRITNRKRKLTDWNWEDRRVLDLTEDESEAASMSEFDSNEGGKEIIQECVLSEEDEDDRKLRSFSSAKDSPVVKYTRKSRLHGQIPTITELANELKRVPSQIVLPVHSIQPAILVDGLYIKFSAEAVEIRGGDSEESLVHEWPLENIVGIGIHYCSNWDEDTRAFVSVRVSIPLSSLPGSSKRVDEYVLDLFKLRDNVADILELSQKYGEIIGELKKGDLEKTVRTIETPNSPTCTAMFTSISDDEDVEKTARTIEGPNSKACTSLLTSSLEEEDVEKAVYTFEMPSSKACTSFLASSSEGLDKAIDDFKVLVYPQADPDAVTITKKDLKILQPFEFLNDTVIDFYIKYLQETIVSSEKLRTLHFFNSFFFSKLAEAVAGGLAAFERVKKWTRKVNIFEKDFVFIPVNQSLHWSLIIICHPGHMWDVPRMNGSSDGDACILHLDSMEGCHRGVQGHIRNYLLQEWLERNKDPEDRAHAEQFFSEMPFRYSKVPQQDNSCDCGLFLLHYVELFLKSAPSIYRMKRQSSPPTQFLRRNWFKPSEASAKRLVIQKLILELSQGSFEICGDHLNTTENAPNAIPADEVTMSLSMALPDDSKSSSPSKTVLDRVHSDSPDLLETQIENRSPSRSEKAELDDDSHGTAISDRQEEYATVQNADVSLEGREVDDRCRGLHHIGSDQSKVSYESGTDQSSAHFLTVDEDIKSEPVAITVPDNETWNDERCPVPRLPLKVKSLQVPDERFPLDRQPSVVVDLGTQDKSELRDNSPCSLSNEIARASENLLNFDNILSPEEDGMYESSSYGGAHQRQFPSNMQSVGHVRASSVRSVQSLFSTPSDLFKEGGRRSVRFTSKSSPLGRCPEFSTQGALNFGQRKRTEDRVLTQKDSNQQYGFTVCREGGQEIQDLSSDDSSDSSKKRDFKKKTPEFKVKPSSVDSGKRVTRSVSQSSGGLILSADKQIKRNALNALVGRRNRTKR